MTMTRKFRSVLGIVLIVAVILAITVAVWMGESRPEEESPSQPPTVSIADETGDWGYPTPYGMYPRGPGYVRMSLIFETLVWKDEEGLTGALAKSWRYDPETTTYSFALRKGLKWHDGEELTAEDVAFTFRYVGEHPWPWLKSGVVKEVVVRDQRRVDIRLDRPYAPFLANVAGTLPILPAHTWRSVEDPKTFRGEGALVGSGPYRLGDYDPAHGTYLYTAWEDYYLGLPRVERIQFVKYSQEMTPAALRRDKVNAGAIPPETVEDLRKGGWRILEQPPVWAAKLMINHRVAPFSQKKVRQAMAYAVDRERLVKIVRRGHGLPGSPGLIPPTNDWWHNPDVRQYNHNPKKARQLLADAGYEPGEDGFFDPDSGEKLQFELLVAPARQEFGRLAEILKGQFEEVGLRVQSRAVEAKTLDALLGEGRFELAISGHGGLGGDPEILNKMIAGKSFNSARYRANSELNQLLENQLRQTNREERRTTVFRIQELYAEEVPAITLYHPTWYWALDGTVELYYTPGGIALGIPLPLNRLAFVR